jgi:hypothetical protein
MAGIVAPVIRSFSPDNNIIGDGITNADLLSLVGTATANITVMVFDGTKLLGTTTVDSSGDWSFITDQLTDGAHIFTVKDMDVAGNISLASSALSVTVDTQAPSAPAITSFSPYNGTISESFSNASHLTLTGTAEANTTVAVFDGATQLGIVTATGSGVWNFITGTLSDGGHSFTATDTDAAGNTSLTSSALNVTVDMLAGGLIPVSSAGSIPASFFGMSVMSTNASDNGPTEAWPTIPFSIERSLAVWSPGDGTVNQIHWADLNPAPGVYNWTELDAWIAECKAHGTAMIYTLEAAPAWAGGSNPDPAALQAFLTAIITHANGQIQYWEGINEYEANFTGSMTQLVTLQQILYQTVKQIDPSGIVLSPSAQDPAGYDIVPFLNAGGGAYFDVLSVHEYVDSSSGGVELMAPWIEHFQTDLNNAGLGNKPIWTTEWGWGNTFPDPNAQAAYASKALVLQAAVGVQRELFYAYDSDVNGVYNLATGMVSAAGVALQETEQWLLGATMPNGYQVNGSVYSAPLTRGGQNSLIVWDSNGSLSYSAGSYTQYVDLQGQVHAITNGVVTIGNAPILLNTGVASSVLSVTIDTTAPVAPAIASFSTDSGVVGDGITNDNTLTLAGTAEANSTVKVYDGATLLGSATANGSGAWSYTTAALSNGAHSLTATASDAAGNTGVASSALAVTVDTVAPNVPVIASDAFVNSNEVMLTGTAEVNSTVNIFEGTTQLGTTTADGRGAWSYTTSPLSNGNHAFTATATDAAGNTSLASQPIDPTIGTVAPAAPTIGSFSPDSNIVGDGITNANHVTLTGTAAAASTVQVFDGATQLGTATANGSGAWSFATAQLADGTHSFTATDTDAAGNTSQTLSALNVKVDTHAPTPTFTNLVQNSHGTVTLSGTSEAHSVLSIYDGTHTTPIGTVTTAANGAWSFTTGPLSNTIHSFTAKAMDVAGNLGSSSGVALYGTTGHDTLKVGPGNHLVTGGSGSDTFVFASNFGKDVITDYQASGWNHDILQFSHNTFSNFAAVLAHATQIGSDVVITADAADTITLTNVHLSSLQKNDIHIV